MCFVCVSVLTALARLIGICSALLNERWFKRTGRNFGLWLREHWVSARSPDVACIRFPTTYRPSRPRTSWQAPAARRRLGLAEAVKSWYQDVGITEFDPNFLANDIPRMKRLYGHDKIWAQRIKEYEIYLDIGVAYDWSFDITETNNADGNIDFIQDRST